MEFEVWDAYNDMGEYLPLSLVYSTNDYPDALGFIKNNSGFYIILDSDNNIIYKNY